MLPQSRPEPGGQQLFEGSRGVVGTVHETVHERCRGSKRRAQGFQFRIEKCVIRVDLVRHVQQFVRAHSPECLARHCFERQQRCEGVHRGSLDAAGGGAGYPGESGNVVHRLGVITPSGGVQPAGNLVGVKQFTAALQRRGFWKRVS